MTLVRSACEGKAMIKRWTSTCMSVERLCELFVGGVCNFLPVILRRSGLEVVDLPDYVTVRP